MNRDKVRERVEKELEGIYRKAYDCEHFEDVAVRASIKIKVDQILSNPLIKIVAEDQTPPQNPHPPLLMGGVDAYSYEMSQQDMVNNHWFKEEV
jgi:hypothetical protein